MEPIITNTTLVPLGSAVAVLVGVVGIFVWFNKSQKELKNEITKATKEQIEAVEKSNTEQLGAMERRLLVVEGKIAHQDTRMAEISERTVRIETKLDIILKK